MVYTDDIRDISSEQLEGFFVGWQNPVDCERHYALISGSTHFIAAMEQNVVIGFITALSDGVISAFIPLLEVLPTYQRQGVGTELLSRMLAKLSGIAHVDLICDADMRSFYGRFAMRPAHGMILRKQIS